MEAENAIKRIREHRVNVAYTAKQYYNAYYRIRDLNNKKAKQRRTLSNISIGIGILLLSGLIVHIAGDNQKLFLISSIVFSLASIILSVHISTLPPINDPFDYLQRAEAFNVLYKNIKTLEARIDDVCVEKDCSINEYLDSIEEKSKVLYTNPLPTEWEDYQKAKKDIEDGQSAYTESDFQNT